MRTSEVSVEVLKAKFRILQFIFMKITNIVKPTEVLGEALRSVRLLSEKFF